MDTLAELFGRILGVQTGRGRLTCHRSAIIWFVAFLLFVVSGMVSAGERSAPDLGELERYIASAHKQWQVPGLAVAIVKDGEIVLARGFGLRHVDAGGTVDEHTLFAIASNTKAFTAAALAILVDEGKLSWDDRVVEHLPYFQLYDPYVSYEMRVRDLLCHRSGLGTFSGDLLWYGTDYSAEEVVKRVRYLPPAGKFRADYGYSNVMFLAAGEVVRAVSGQTWATFVKERIFEQLDMQNTVTSIRKLQGEPNVATPHKNLEDRVVAIEWYNWDNMVAAGGIISSVSDMAKWLQLQLGRGELNGKRLFSEQASRTLILTSGTGAKNFCSAKLSVGSARSGSAPKKPNSAWPIAGLRCRWRSTPELMAVPCTATPP